MAIDPIVPGSSPRNLGSWFITVFGNAIAGYLLAVLNDLLPDGFSHLAALSAMLTTTVVLWAIDAFAIHMSPARAEIRRILAKILWIKGVLQVLPIYDVIMGHIAIGFIGIHVYGLSYKPVVGPVGLEWGYHAQVYATVLTMAALSAAPLFAYAIIRGIIAHRLGRPRPGSRGPA